MLDHSKYDRYCMGGAGNYHLTVVIRTRSLVLQRAMYVCMYVDTVARSRASENNNQGLYFLKNE